MNFYDLIIVGGGIGGSALAAVMAKAGKRVLLLEQSAIYEDRVRGEWIAPWGVAEVKRLGLYDLLLGAGGHHVLRHTTYDETRAPADSEARTIPLGIFFPDIPGPLCIGHPHHCQTLFDEAKRSGAEALRSVDVTEIVAHGDPHVTYTYNGETYQARAKLVVGADGRMSKTRDVFGIKLHQDKPHHWFAGLLLEGAHGWPDDLQAIGTESDLGFLAFPQGKGRLRVYGGYALEQRSRFSGSDGARRFLEALRMESAPNNQYLTNAKPAGPLYSYVNNDSWTDKPFVESAVLIGDAAGWNDPILGLGLSITYRDVRSVFDILKISDDWSPNAFAAYAEERAERMRRLRFAAKLQAALDMEFGDAARAKRKSFYERSDADASLGMHALAVMGGPETVPPEFFTEAHRARVLEG